VLMIFVHHRLHGLRELGKDGSPIFGKALACLSKRGIPPTAVGGLFRSFLQKESPETVESPQRQLGDCSDPTYKKSPPETVESPQRQLGDCSDPAYKKSAVEAVESPQRQLGDCSDPALHRLRSRPYSSSIYLTPFAGLDWAYQLTTISGSSECEGRI
jgi:hypothetical protein